MLYIVYYFSLILVLKYSLKPYRLILPLGPVFRFTLDGLRKNGWYACSLSLGKLIRVERAKKDVSSCSASVPVRAKSYVPKCLRGQEVRSGSYRSRSTGTLASQAISLGWNPDSLYEGRTGVFS